MFLCLNFYFSQLLFGTTIHVSGDKMRRSETSLIIANHRTRLDWMFMWSLTGRAKWSALLKIILRGDLRHLPGFGKCDFLCSLSTCNLILCFHFLFEHFLTLCIGCRLGNAVWWFLLFIPKVGKRWAIFNQENKVSFFFLSNYFRADFITQIATLTRAAHPSPSNTLPPGT